jgi:hypothetical protein
MPDAKLKKYIYLILLGLHNLLMGTKNKNDIAFPGSLN